jgi:GT2 family glycosyltransferase
VSRDLRIVIVNWCTAEMTSAAVRSVLTGTQQLSYEVVIVDNASPDGSGEALRRNFSGERRVRVLQAERNLGFAGANNLALRDLGSRAVLLLNSDTLVNGNAAGRAFEHLLRTERTGMVGCRLLNADGSLQRSCSHFPRVLTPLLGKMFLAELRQGALPGSPRWFASAYTDREHEHELSPDWLMGAFMLCRTEAVLDVGPLDEEVFMYSEDLEWCYRFRTRGWGIEYTPAASVVHFGGGSSRPADPKTERQQVDGLHHFMRKHRGPLRARMFAACSALSCCVQAVADGLSPARRQLARSDVLRLRHWAGLALGAQRNGGAQ